MTPRAGRKNGEQPCFPFPLPPLSASWCPKEAKQQPRREGEWNATLCPIPTLSLQPMQLLPSQAHPAAAPPPPQDFQCPTRLRNPGYAIGMKWGASFWLGEQIACFAVLVFILMCNSKIKEGLKKNTKTFHPQV